MGSSTPTAARPPPKAKQILPCPTYPRRRRRLHAIFLSSVLLLTAFLWLYPPFPSYPSSFSYPFASPLHQHHARSFPYDCNNETLDPLPPSPDSPLSLRHIVFGVASSSHLWPRRREYIRLWWRATDMHGHVWMDDRFPEATGIGPAPNPSPLPPVRVSGDISRFRYSNPNGDPSAIRIARIVAESFRLGHQDARWFVLSDDDTIMSPENLVVVLGKYDWREMIYVGGSSECHGANTYFSHSMAFGGGGIAISYPLARALAEMQDECLERYPELYGSDDRLHACISELGVPLTLEKGFHQWDIRGNAHGLLAAHPIAPFVSIHHVEAVDPIYPGLDSLESLKLFTKAMNIEPKSFLQQSICYDMKRKWTFSVSLGYVVQVFPNVVLPRDLGRSERTYAAWNWKGAKGELDLDTRDADTSICYRPILFFLSDVRKHANVTTGIYLRAEGRGDRLKRKLLCFRRPPLLPGIEEIRVLSNPLDENWPLVPRRLCCKIAVTTSKHLLLVAGQCGRRM